MERLLEVMRRLRGPGGCPWDRAQTHESLVPYLLEEASEAAAAAEVHLLLLDGGDDLNVLGVESELYRLVSNLLLSDSLHAPRRGGGAEPEARGK